MRQKKERSKMLMLKVNESGSRENIIDVGYHALTAFLLQLHVKNVWESVVWQDSNICPFL